MVPQPVLDEQLSMGIEGGELSVAFMRSPLRTSRTHVSAVGWFGGLPLPRLTGGAVGDTTIFTRDSGICCFILSSRRCVVLLMYLCPHAQVKR